MMVNIVNDTTVREPRNSCLHRDAPSEKLSGNEMQHQNCQLANHPSDLRVSDHNVCNCQKLRQETEIIQLKKIQPWLHTTLGG